MSKTHRIHPPKMYRRPKTFNLIRMNDGLVNDVRSGDIEFNISKMNRINRFIPDSWEDIPISSNFEYDPKNKYN